MSWSVNDVMPGSDGLRIWRFWKTCQLGVDFGPCRQTVGLSTIMKLFKLDEPDMQDTAGEAEMNS